MTIILNFTNGLSFYTFSQDVTVLSVNPIANSNVQTTVFRSSGWTGWGFNAKEFGGGTAISGEKQYDIFYVLR